MQQSQVRKVENRWNFSTEMLASLVTNFWLRFCALFLSASQRFSFREYRPTTQTQPRPANGHYKFNIFYQVLSHQFGFNLYINLLIKF